MRQFKILGIALLLWTSGLQAYPRDNEYHPEVTWHADQISIRGTILRRFSLPCYQTLQQVETRQEDPRYRLFKAEIFGENGYLRLPVYRFAEMRPEMVFLPWIGKVASAEEAGKLIAQLQSKTKSKAWSLPTVLDIPLLYSLPIIDSSHRNNEDFFFWVFIPKREVQLALFRQSDDSKLKFVEYVKRCSPEKYPVVALFNSGRVNKNVKGYQQ